MHLDAQLHTPEFYAGDPFPVYRRLRREAPVYWYEPRGWWALSRYEDVRWVSSHPELFTSERGIMIPDTGEVTPEMLDLLIFMDPPRHRKLRTRIKHGFTPGVVARLEPRLRQLAREILANIEPDTTFNFADVVASPLPTIVIAELIGAPREDWPRFRQWSDAIIGSLDPDETLTPEQGHAGLHEYFLGLIEARRKEPRDDLLSSLVHAEVEGTRLDEVEVYHMCWLLLIAGNETTRNLISLGTRALLEHPDQLERLQEDPRRIPVAIEEMLRWCCPVTHMCRVAVEDVEIRGQSIRAGQMIALLYGAANRDEEVFGDDAEDFVVTRYPNRHVQFGFGEHICVGAHLARLEARVMFEELLPLLGRAELRGEMRRLLSTMVPGVREMPLRIAA